MNEKRRGRQEPTTGFTLPYQATKGSEAIALYNETSRTAQEWQENILYDMMAVDDDGLWVHSRFGFSVPRQNGKNECLSMREMWGLRNGERMLHTAHRTATSRAAWERLCYLLEQSGIHEIKGQNRTGYTSGKSKGQEWVELDEEHGGGKIYFRTRSTSGGLGETFDALLIDEAQCYQDDQESALKYTIVSSPNPQTIYLGTPPTPYSSGTIFPSVRQKILCGEMKHAGWAEWSVEEQTAMDDVDAWYETNPSLGYTLTERAIEDEIGSDEIDFNIQRLGLWIKYNQKSAISKTDWSKCQVDKLPELHGKLCVGIKFNRDGSSVAVSVAAKTADDCIFAECIGRRSMRDGVGWIVEFLADLGGNYTKAVVDGANGFEILAAQMKNAKLKAPHKPSVKEYIDANAFFEQSIYRKTLLHTEQPSVTELVTNCEKRAIGSSGGFGYKPLQMQRDIAILDSMALAVWGCEQFKPARKQRISY